MGKGGQKDAAESNVIKRIEAVPEGRDKVYRDVLYRRWAPIFPCQPLAQVVLDPDMDSVVPRFEERVRIRCYFTFEYVDSDYPVPVVLYYFAFFVYFLAIVAKSNSDHGPLAEAERHVIKQSFELPCNVCIEELVGEVPLAELVCVAVRYGVVCITDEK